MKNKLVVCSLVLVSALVFSTAALADDVYIGYTWNGSEWVPDNPVELTLDDDFSATHEDSDPFKGSAFVSVKNTGTEAWGDFHFKIFSYDTSDISQVDFKDASMGGVDPTSSQALDSWTIDNVVVGAEMSLFYYNDPVQPGETANFEVYTDNTASEVNFGLMIWPSPVPEPATVALLAAGCGIMVALRRRKR